MIDITNCNKIIVDTIGKTEKIIEWYQQNKDWLDAEEFRIPIPSALVELPEEDIKFYYEQEGVFVRLHLYMGGVYVCNYRYDPKTQEIENIVFPTGLSKEKRKVARMVLAADRTPYKEALKFHSLIETKFLFHQISELYRLLRHNIFDEVVGFLRPLHSTVNIFEKCLISRRTATD